MALYDEILALPAAVRAQQNTQLIADTLSQKCTVLGRIERAEFAMWAAKNGMRAKIEDHAVNPSSPLRSVALACRDVILGAATAIDFSLADNRQMLESWVQAGELSAAERDVLLQRATRDNPVNEYVVRCLCWSDDGRWLV